MAPVYSKVGSFRQQIANHNNIIFSDFKNIANFFTIYKLPKKDFIIWCQQKGLLRATSYCDICKKNQSLYKCSKKGIGYIFGCKNLSSHEQSILTNSFFENSKIVPQDILLFIRSYLIGLNNKTCCSEVGISEQTGVDWTNFIRDIFVEEVYDVLNSGQQLSGVVEIDESLFGHKYKYNKGHRTGTGVWIFGLIQKTKTFEDTPKLLLFPVEQRDKATLLPIILKYVKKGSIILSDSWGAYFDLNELNYKHFSCSHKSSFEQKYVNKTTGKTISINTNSIEGAWAHAKHHFKTIYGCHASTFNSHLCEIMWRWWHNNDEVIIETYLNQLIALYPLTEPKQTKATFPIFPLELCYNHDQNDQETTLEFFEEPNPALNISTQEIDEILGVVENNEDSEEITPQTFTFSSSFVPKGATAFVNSKEPKTVESKSTKKSKGQPKLGKRSKNGLSCPSEYSPVKKTYKSLSGDLIVMSEDSDFQD